VEEEVTCLVCRVFGKKDLRGLWEKSFEGSLKGRRDGGRPASAVSAGELTCSLLDEGRKKPDAAGRPAVCRNGKWRRWGVSLT